MKSKYLILGFFFVCTGLATSCGSQTNGTNGEVKKDAGRVYLEALRQDKNTPGISAAIAVDGKTIWEYGSGFSVIDQKKKASPQTVYRIASVSKLITTAALAKMVEEGQLTFSDDANRFFSLSDEQMTIAQLLSHTSGIRHYNYNERVENYPHYDNVVKATEIFINDPLEFSPGEKYQYSSYGIDLIGAIIEKKAGKPFEKYVQKNVLAPLKMKHTFLSPPKYSENLAKFYANDQTLVPEIDLSYNIPGGGMYSTVQDLVQFGNAFLTEDYLRESIKNQLFTRTKLNDGQEIPYGLGWMIQKLEDGSALYYHDGHMDGTHSILVVYPKYKASISMIANRGSNWGLEEALALFCKVNAIEKCPSIIVEGKQMDRELVMGLFQNLNSRFQNFQTAITNSDRSAIEGVVASSFQSKVWEGKTAFVDFLMKVGNQYEVFDVDLSVKGLEEGDKAYVKTIRFQEQYPDNTWFLKYVLHEGQWSLVSIDQFE